MKYDYEPLLDPANKFSIARKELEKQIREKSLKTECNFELKNLTSQNDFFEWLQTPLFELEKIFINERENLTKNKTYFFGCSFEVYKLTYDLRLQSYFAIYNDATERDFIEYEKSKKYNDFYELQVNDYVNEHKFEYSILCDYTLNNQILFSLQKRASFLNEKLNTTGIVETQEPEAIDLSETTATEKIIYLYKLGIIDFLRNKQPFKSSTNSLATVLSAITGINPDTKHIQSMLNPIVNKQVGQKNNPLNSTKTVLKVETQLTNIGFDLNETI